MATQQNPLLELTTKRIRRTIKVDEKHYELRFADELSLVAQGRVEKERAKFAALIDALKTREANDQEEADLSRGLTSLVNDVVIDGAEFAAQLNDTQKLMVVNSFLAPAGAKPATTAAAMKRARQPKKK